MADFSSIRFQPKRPLLREISADRLNSIVAEIKKNRPLPGRGIAVRQTGQGTAIDLATTVSNKSSLIAQPWDLKAASDPANEGQYLVTVRPGTLNGILPSNWDEEFSCNSNSLYYAKAVIATDGEAITGVTIEIDAISPDPQTPVEFAIPSSVKYLFGLFAQGQVYRVIGDGHIDLFPTVWLVADKNPPAQPGELPYSVYYTLQ